MLANLLPQPSAGITGMCYHTQSLHDVAEDKMWKGSFSVVMWLRSQTLNNNCWILLTDGLCAHAEGIFRSHSRALPQPSSYSRDLHKDKYVSEASRLESQGKKHKSLRFLKNKSQLCFLCSWRGENGVSAWENKAGGSWVSDGPELYNRIASTKITNLLKQQKQVNRNRIQDKESYENDLRESIGPTRRAWENR